MLGNVLAINKAMYNEDGKYVEVMFFSSAVFFPFPIALCALPFIANAPLPSNASLLDSNLMFPIFVQIRYMPERSLSNHIIPEGSQLEATASTHVVKVIISVLLISSPFSSASRCRAVPGPNRALFLQADARYQPLQNGAKNATLGAPGNSQHDFNGGRHSRCRLKIRGTESRFRACSPAPRTSISPHFNFLACTSPSCPGPFPGPSAIHKSHLPTTLPNRTRF